VLADWSQPRGGGGDGGLIDLGPAEWRVLYPAAHRAVQGSDVPHDALSGPVGRRRDLAPPVAEHRVWPCPCRTSTGCWYGDEHAHPPIGHHGA